MASAESDEFVINLSMKTEFDGFIDTSITVAPKGRSVKQIFGLEKLKEQQALVLEQKAALEVQTQLAQQQLELVDLEIKNYDKLIEEKQIFTLTSATGSAV